MTHEIIIVCVIVSYDSKKMAIIQMILLSDAFKIDALD